VHFFSGKISVSCHGLACGTDTVNYRDSFLFKAVLICSSRREAGGNFFLKAFYEVCVTCAHMSLHVFPGSTFTRSLCDGIPLQGLSHVQYTVYSYVNSNTRIL
jgi:hypothetical protein